MDFSNYKFRCSSLGKLMVGVKPNLTENQNAELLRLQGNQKNGKITEKQLITLGDLLSKKNAKNDLSVTTQNYLKELHKEILFKRSKDLQNKYCDKGIQVEEKSLTLYSNISNVPFFKNSIRFENEYISGEPDNVKDKIRDIKSSWDYSTFPFYETEINNSIYEWQLEGYMALTGLKNAELIYTLIDTPTKLINDELRRLDWKENVMDNEGNIRINSIPLVVEVISNMIYTLDGLKLFCAENENINIEWFEGFREVPENLRCKVFYKEFDAENIKILYSQIEKCRKFMTDLSLQVADKIA